MKQIYIGLLVVAFCTNVMGCAGVFFGKNKPVASETEQAAQTVENTQTVGQNDSEQPKVDCDTFMKGLADSCFAVMAFEADGKTPLHMKDEVGNDLGEVDQAWVKSYCQCYAQTAFQTFGCSAVMADEALDDAAYSEKYETIVAACSSEGESVNTDTGVTEGTNTVDNAEMTVP